VSNFTYLVQPFSTTTFTSPLAGTNDVISALTSDDFTINGNGGNDAVSTGSGNDTITTGAGVDVIKAGDGNNTVNAGDGKNAVTTGSGNDTITTGAGADVIQGGDGNNTVNAGDGKNVVTTGSGDDTITTGAGADVITAGGGDDGINAGAGNDTITPGGGADSIIGGGGHDTFIYGSLAEALLGADTISDFSTTSVKGLTEGDLLNLKGLVAGFTGVHGVITLESLVASGHLDFSGDSSNTVISFDSNGSAVGGSVGVLVTLVGVAFATEADSVVAFHDTVVVR
jgi:Ca2+-binding RTX toxin-like protein